MTQSKFQIGARVFPSGIDTFRRFPGNKPPKSGNVRGEVKQFSTQARCRLRRRLLCYDWPSIIKERRAIWITLTAREGTPNDFKKWFDAWRARVMYAWHGTWIFWRIEYQKRGVIHYHLIVVMSDGGATRDALGKLVSWWREIAGKVNALRCSQHIRIVRSITKIAIYVSDASKVTQATPPPGEAPGRWWGVRGKHEGDKIEPIELLGEDIFYDMRRFVRGLRTGRNRTIKRKRRTVKTRKVGKVKDSVEFFDTSKLEWPKSKPIMLPPESERAKAVRLEAEQTKRIVEKMRQRGIK